MSRRSEWQRRTLVRLAGASVVVALAGCTAAPPSPTSTSTATATVSPTPTPTPTDEPTPAPAADALVLTSDGLGPLVLGEPIASDLVVWDPEYCARGRDYPVEEEYRGKWIPVLPTETVELFGAEQEVLAFEANHGADGTLAWLQVRGSSIPTDRGITVGSSLEEVVAAYPEAEVYDGYSARAFGITGERGRLVIEVFTDATDGRTPGVWSMRVDPVDWRFSSLANGDAGSFCGV